MERLRNVESGLSELLDERIEANRTHRAKLDHLEGKVDVIHGMLEVIRDRKG